MNDCIFCKIVTKELPGKIYLEEPDFLVFHDINPMSEFHLLIVPKEHIASVREADSILISKMIEIANKIAKSENLAGYKLLFNVGERGGQVIFHLHLHLIGYRE